MLMGCVAAQESAFQEWLVERGRRSGASRPAAAQRQAWPVRGACFRHPGRPASPAGCRPRSLCYLRRCPGASGHRLAAGCQYILTCRTGCHIVHPAYEFLAFRTCKTAGYAAEFGYNTAAAAAAARLLWRLRNAQNRASHPVSYKKKKGLHRQNRLSLAVIGDFGDCTIKISSLHEFAEFDPRLSGPSKVRLRGMAFAAQRASQTHIPTSCLVVLRSGSCVACWGGRSASH